MRWIIFACTLFAAVPAVAGDRDDDQWFWQYNSTHSPRARQEAAREERAARGAAVDQWMAEQAAANRHQEIMRELRALRRDLGD